MFFPPPPSPESHPSADQPGEKSPSLVGWWRSTTPFLRFCLSAGVIAGVIVVVALWKSEYKVLIKLAFPVIIVLSLAVGALGQMAIDLFKAYAGDYRHSQSTPLPSVASPVEDGILAPERLDAGLDMVDNVIEVASEIADQISKPAS